MKQISFAQGYNEKFISGRRCFLLPYLHFLPPFSCVSFSLVILIFFSLAAKQPLKIQLRVWAALEGLLSGVRGRKCIFVYRYLKSGHTSGGCKCCYIFIYMHHFCEIQAVKKQTKNENKYTARENNTIPATTLRIYIAINMI